MTSIFLQLRKSQNVLNFCSHLFENQLRYESAPIGIFRGQRVKTLMTLFDIYIDAMRHYYVLS